MGIRRRERERMERRLFTILLALLLVVFLLTNYIFRPVKAVSNTIIVPDDFPTIQEAINEAFDGDTVFVKAGTYYEHVVVNKTVSLVGEEVNTTTIDGGDTGHVVHVVRNNATVTGFTIRNSGHIQAPYLEAGICLNHTIGCIISGNHLADNGFSGISLLSSEYSRVVDNSVNHTEWGAIHMLGSSHNIVSGNIVDNTTSEYGIGISGHASSHYNTITENVILNSRYGMLCHDFKYNSIYRNNISNAIIEGIQFQDMVNNNVVAENSLANCTVAISVQGPNSNNVLSGNVITGARYGIRIQDYASYTRIVENIIEENDCGIQIQRAGNTEIFNNTIAHNYGDEWEAGIRLDYADHTRIYSNVIVDNWRGILVYTGSPYVSICGNNISSNDFAVRVASGGSDYANISDNILMNNRGYGIGLTGFGGASNYATISGNNIVNNSDGIALGQYSNYNTIFHNNISLNGYGFYIEYSTQNTIWGNNVIYNDQQVYVSTSSLNNWNSSYPTGGNYWSDYNGCDHFSGPGQDKPDADGVGDVPYAVGQSDLDWYPLMFPYGWVPIPLPSDVNGDWKVDLKDVCRVALAFGAYGCNYLFQGSPEHPRWKVECDINKDNQVDLKDYYLVCKGFGKEWEPQI